jgi:hypothetical protein
MLWHPAHRQKLARSRREPCRIEHNSMCDLHPLTLERLRHRRTWSLWGELRRPGHWMRLAVCVTQNHRRSCGESPFLRLFSTTRGLFEFMVSAQLGRLRQVGTLPSTATNCRQPCLSPALPQNRSRKAVWRSPEEHFQNATISGETEPAIMAIHCD